MGFGLALTAFANSVDISRKLDLGGTGTMTAPIGKRDAPSDNSDASKPLLPGSTKASHAGSAIPSRTVATSLWSQSEAESEADAEAREKRTMSPENTATSFYLNAGSIKSDTSLNEFRAYEKNSSEGSLAADLPSIILLIILCKRDCVVEISDNRRPDSGHPAGSNPGLHTVPAEEYGEFAA